MPVPVEFKTLLQSQVKDRKIFDEISRLIEIKTAGNEQDLIKQNTLLHEYLIEKLEYYKERLRLLPDKKSPDPEPLNKLFREIIFELGNNI